MRHTPNHLLPGPTQATTTAAPVSGYARAGLALIARTIAGAVLLLGGAAMLVLPGPGFLVIVAGLSLLAVDYLWARRLRALGAERLAATGRRIRRAVAAQPSRRHDPDHDCDGPAHTDRQVVRHRDGRRGAEHPSTRVPR
jgi:hypothetical protein